MTRKIRFREYIKKLVVYVTILALVLVGALTLTLTNSAGEYGVHDNAVHALNLPTYEGYNFTGKRKLISLSDFDRLHNTGSMFHITPEYSNVNTYYITINDAIELYSFSYRACGRLNTGSVMENGEAQNFYPKARYILGDNIDYSPLASLGFLTVGSSDFPFSGEFDGQGFEVSNLTIDTDDTRTNAKQYYSMFAYNSGTIKNLGVVTTAWTASGTVVSHTMSALVGRNTGMVLNCYAQTGSNTLTAENTAGLVYDNRRPGQITDSYFAGRLSGTVTGALVADNGTAGDTGTVTNSCYDSSLHAQSAAGTGIATAALQAMTGVLATADNVYYTHTGTYPKLYGIRTDYKIYRPADLVYFPRYIEAGNTTRAMRLANCIDMSAVSEKAYTPNATAFGGSLTSDMTGACPIGHFTDTPNSHSIINLRITNYTLTAVSGGTDYTSGLLVTTSNANISNINFVGGYTRLPALEKSAQTQETTFSAGMLIGRHIVNGVLNVNNVHSSANVFSQELDSSGNYSVMGYRLFLGGIIGYAGYANATLIQNVSCNGVIYGGTHTTYRSGTTATLLATGGIIGSIGGTSASYAPDLLNLTFSGTVYGGRVFKIENGTGSKLPGMYAGGIVGYSDSSYIDTRAGGISNEGEVYSGPLNPIEVNPNAYPNPNNNFIASGGRAPDVTMTAAQATTSGPSGAPVATGGIFGRGPAGDWTAGNAADSLRNDGRVYCVEYQGNITVGGNSQMLSYLYWTAGIAGTLGGTWTISGLRKNGIVEIYNPTKTLTIASHMFAGFVSGTSAASFNDCSLTDPVIMDSYAYGTTEVIAVSGFAYVGGAVNSYLKNTSSANADAGKVMFRTKTTQMPDTHRLSKLMISGFSGIDTSNSGLVYTNCLSNGEVIIGQTGQTQYINNTRISGFASYIYSCNGIANTTKITVNCKLDLLATGTSGAGLLVGGLSAYGRALTNAINMADINIDEWLPASLATVTDVGGVSGITVASDFNNVINMGNITFKHNTSSPAGTVGTLRIGGIFGTDLSSGSKARLINRGAVNIEMTGSGRNAVCSAGGVIGYSSMTYRDLFNTGSVTFKNALNTATGNVGGIIGYLYSTGSVYDSVNTGSVTGNIDATAGTGVSAGGIVGSSASSVGIANCINFGTISGLYNAGGIIGTITGGALTYCINYGDIRASSNAHASVRLGGLAGNMSSALTHAYLVNYGRVSVAAPTLTSSGTIAGNRSNGSLNNLLSVYSGTGTVKLLPATTGVDMSTSASTETGATGANYYPRTDSAGGIYHESFFLRANSTLSQMLVYTDMANAGGRVGPFATAQAGTGYPMLYVITTSLGRDDAFYLFENFAASAFSAGNVGSEIAAEIGSINADARACDQIRWPADCEIMSLSLRDTSANNMKTLTVAESILVSVETPTVSTGTITYVLTSTDTAGKGTTSIPNIQYVIDTITYSNRATITGLLNADLTTPFSMTINPTVAQTFTGYIVVTQTYGAQVYSKVWEIIIIFTPTVKQLIVTNLEIIGRTGISATSPGTASALLPLTIDTDYIYGDSGIGTVPRVESYTIKDGTLDKPEDEVYYSGGQLRVSFDTTSFYETETLRNNTYLYWLNESILPVQKTAVTAGWVTGATNGIVTGTATGVDGITRGKVFIHLTFTAAMSSGRYVLEVRGIAEYSDIYINFTKEKNRESTVSVTGTNIRIPFIVGGALQLPTTGQVFSTSNTIVNNMVSATGTHTYSYGNFIDLSIFSGNPDVRILNPSDYTKSLIKGASGSSITLSPNAKIDESHKPVISVTQRNATYNTRTVVLQFVMLAEAYDEAMSDEYNAQFKRLYTLTLNENDPVTTIVSGIIDTVPTNFPNGYIVNVERTGKNGDITIIYNNPSDVDIIAGIVGIYNRFAGNVQILKEGLEYIPIAGEVPATATAGKTSASQATQVDVKISQQTTGGVYTITPIARAVNWGYTYDFGSHDITFYGVKPATGELVWEEYSLTPITVEKLSSKDAYITNIEFQLDPAAADIKDETENQTPENVHRGIIVGTVDTITTSSTYGAVTYLRQIDSRYFDPSHPDRCTDFTVIAMYSSDGYSVDNVVTLTPPVGATLEMWDETLGDYVRLAYWVIEDGEDVLKLDNGGFRMLREGETNLFRVTAENSSYKTYYTIQLGGAPQNKVITVITRVPTGYNKHLIFQMFTLIRQASGSTIFTRTTSFTYNPSGAVAGTGGDAGYMVKTHGFINHIPAYYSIGCVVPLGYKYSITATNSTGEVNMLVMNGDNIVLDQFGRPYMDLNSLSGESSVITITVLSADSPEWGLYTETIT